MSRIHAKVRAGLTRKEPVEMAPPAYTPNGFTRHPHRFGKGPDIEWKPLDPMSRAPALAARVQHHQCVILQEAILREYRSIRAFIDAHSSELSDHFYRTLSGDAVLQPRTLAYLIWVLGPDLNLPSETEILRPMFERDATEAPDGP